MNGEMLVESNKFQIKFDREYQDFNLPIDLTKRNKNLSETTENALKFQIKFKSSQLEWLILTHGQIKFIEKNNIFLGLENLKILDLSNNQIRLIDKHLFKSLHLLTHLYLNDNNVSSLHKETFAHLKSLIKIDLSFNQIKHLPKTTFHNLENLKELSLNNNQLKEINKSAFHGLFRLQKLNLGFNQLNQIDRVMFKELNNLEEIKLNDNQLSLWPNSLFKDNRSLMEINIENNFIRNVSVSDFTCLKQECTINMRNNIEFYDFPFIFNSLFRFVKRDKCLNVEYLESAKKFFIVRQFNFENFLLSFYLNKAVFKVQLLFNENCQKSFAYALAQLNTHRFTLLDFFLSYQMIDASFLIYFKEYFVNILKENKQQAQNLEFKLKSPQSFEVLCERNDLLLFETFFESEITLLLIKENPWIFNFKEFYLSINFVKCFRIILGNRNEKLAILLVKLLAFVCKKFETPRLGFFLLHDEYKYVIEFNRVFLM